MPDATLSPAPVVPVAAWNEDVVFSALADPVRRRLLFSLARNGAQPASRLMSVAGRRLDATLKQLVTLRAAGLLVTTPDPQDGRRMLYALAPAVPLVKMETGVVIDFGFCRLRPA
jgi:DNA-binding transcriptional ArsR family regulator